MSRGLGGTRGWRSGADSPWSLHGNESCPHQSQPGEPCAGLLPQGRSASPVFSMLLTLGPLDLPTPPPLRSLPPHPGWFLTTLACEDVLPNVGFTGLPAIAYLTKLTLMPGPGKPGLVGSSVIPEGVCPVGGQLS